MGEQAAEKLLWQTRTSLTYTFGGTREDHAGRSKRPTSKAAGESKPEACPRGHVEDFDEPRTKLAGFFSILLVGLPISIIFPRKRAVRVASYFPEPLFILI
jgi:hypothetical protein